MKVVALKRIHRRDEHGRRTVVPVGAIFEIEAEGKEHKELRGLESIKTAKASDIELAKENPKLRVKGRLQRARTIKELQALKAAKEFAAENPKLVDPADAPPFEEEELDNEGDEGNEDDPPPVVIPPSTPVVKEAAPVKAPVTAKEDKKADKPKRKNLV